MKESMVSCESEEPKKAEDSGTSGPIPLAEDCQAQKIKEPDEAEKNEVSEDIQEDIATCKKRRRVNSTLQHETWKGKQREEVASLQNNPMEQGTQVTTPEGMGNLCDIDKNGMQGSTAVMNSVDSPQTPEIREPTIGVVLPLQRKDIHSTRGGDDDSSVPSSSVDVLTPKRQKRHSNQERDAANTQESPTRRSARGVGKETPIKPSDSELPGAPGYPARKRTRVMYKEQSDEEESGESALPPSPDHAAPTSSQSQNTKKHLKASAGKDGVLDQSSPKTRKGRKNVWDKEVLLTSKNSKLVMAADLTVSFKSCGATTS